MKTWHESMIEFAAEYMGAFMNEPLNTLMGLYK